MMANMPKNGADWIVCSSAGTPVHTFDSAQACALWLESRPNTALALGYRVLCVERHVHEVTNVAAWVPALLGRVIVPPPGPLATVLASAYQPLPVP